MITITAVIRAKKGCDSTLRDALLEVARNVQEHEPGTIDFYISQDERDPCVFTTYERFADVAAMDQHNASPEVARFFGIAKPLLEGEVVLVTAREISRKS